MDVHQVGSHLRLKHATKPGRVTIPGHAGIILSPKTLSKGLLEQASLTAEELSEADNW
jgi:predicted RNA binding protein YcfA (HicA-like mRNA interferase family)